MLFQIVWRVSMKSGQMERNPFGHRATGHSARKPENGPSLYGGQLSWTAPAPCFASETRHENIENRCFRSHARSKDLYFKRRKTALFRHYQQLTDSGLYQNPRGSIRFFRRLPDLFFHRIKPQVLPAFCSILLSKED